MGYVRGKVDSIEQKLDNLNGDFSDMQKKVQRHDIIFGKIGVYISLFVFVISLGINFVIDLFRERFK